MPAADVAFSDQFLDEIFSLGTSVRIIGPEEVVEKYAGEVGHYHRCIGKTKGNM